MVALKEGEVISYNPLTEELKTRFIEDDEVRENTPTIGYYARIELLNGFVKSIYWNKKKMVEHAKKYSQLYRTDLTKGWTMSFWSKNFDEMAFKTLLRQLISKWGAMSIEMHQAYDNDQTITDENGNASYIDNPEDKQKPEQEQEQTPINITPTAEEQPQEPEQQLEEFLI